MVGGVSGGGRAFDVAGLVVEADGVTGTTDPAVSDIRLDIESLPFFLAEGVTELVFLFVEGGAGVEGGADGQFCE